MLARIDSFQHAAAGARFGFIYGIEGKPERVSAIRFLRLVSFDGSEGDVFLPFLSSSLDIF